MCMPNVFTIHQKSLKHYVKQIFYLRVARNREILRRTTVDTLIYLENWSSFIVNVLVLFKSVPRYICTWLLVGSEPRF